MPTAMWDEFRISIIAGLCVDKLMLATPDVWAFSSRLSSLPKNSILQAFLWTVPQLGSCKLLASNMPLGEDQAYGVIVGDGQKVTSINPLLTEWIFNQYTVATGSCLFIKATSSFRKGDALAANASTNPTDPLSLVGPLATALVAAVLWTASSIGHFAALFFGCVYLSTLASNLYLATQSRNSWAGFTQDAEPSQMLILAPGDRWAVVSGPRNLVKTITTGSHTGQTESWIRPLGQYLLVGTIISAGLLGAATLQDGMLLAAAFGALQLVSMARSRAVGRSPVIRGVEVARVERKSFGRRAELVEELSQTAMSDAWAYESGLLTRRYVSSTSKIVDKDY